MGYPETFEGFRSQSHKDWTTFKKETWTPKKWEDRDVDVKIDACGVCGSDVHTIDGGWVSLPMPLHDDQLLTTNTGRGSHASLRRTRSYW